MKICFLWAKDFKGLKDHEINLCSEYKYNLDFGNGAISRVEKQKYPKFFGDGIADVTGLLGINGAGKTNTLEFICRAITRSIDLSRDYIVLYEKDEKIACLTSLEKLNFKGFEAAIEDSKEILNYVNVVYFSNVFDQNFIDFDRSVKDISVNYKNNPKNVARRKGNRHLDFLNDLEFLTSNEYLKIDLESPRMIEIRVEKAIVTIGRESKGYYSEAVSQYFARLRRGSGRRMDPIENVSLIIKIEFFLSILDSAVLFKNSVADYVVECIENQNRNGNYPTIDALISEVDAYCLISSSSVPWDEHMHLSEALHALSSIDILFRKMECVVDDSYRKSRYVLLMNYDSRVNGEVRRIASILRGVRFSSISWAGLSSGQKAYLNIFSSIWGALKPNRSPVNKRKLNLVCIDEGDLYLHPRWQIEFIDRLITGLPKLSDELVQFVISTHSPILISDLPRQCVLNINRKEPSVDSPDYLTLRSKTFGANIFDIYKYSFGMDGQRIGVFSERYIKHLLEIVDLDAYTPEQIAELELGVSVIDDDLISSYISNRISKK